MHCSLDTEFAVYQKTPHQSAKWHILFTGLTVCSLSLFVCVLQRGSLTQIPVVKETRVESGQFLVLSVLCMLFILVALAVSATFFCVRQRSHLRMKEKLASLGTDTSTDATATYQVSPAFPRCEPIRGRDTWPELCYWMITHSVQIWEIFWLVCGSVCYVWVILFFLLLLVWFGLWWDRLALFYSSIYYSVHLLNIRNHVFVKNLTPMLFIYCIFCSSRHSLRPLFSARPCLISVCVAVSVCWRVSETGEQAATVTYSLCSSRAMGSQGGIDFQRWGSAVPSMVLRTYLSACRVNIFNI